MGTEFPVTQILKTVDSIFYGHAYTGVATAREAVARLD